MTRTICDLSVIGFACLLFAGCGGRDLAPVEGIVTFDGQPLPEAAITLLPEKGQPATALTTAEGKFQVRSNNDLGAAVGHYKVLVMKDEPDARAAPTPAGKSIGEATPEELSRGMRAMGPSTRKSFVPKLYTDPMQTPLTVDVPQGGSRNVELKLNSVAEKK